MCALKGMFSVGASLVGIRTTLHRDIGLLAYARACQQLGRVETDERDSPFYAAAGLKEATFKEELHEEIDKWLKYVI